jgi:hypothetical protein
MRTSIDRRPPPRPALLWTLTACWALALGGGSAFLVRYAGTPGPSAAAPERWPVASRVRRQAGEPTLVMILHPHCPCSRASLRELEKILARAPSAAAHVLFTEPSGAEPGWADTDIVRAASAIPGVEVLVDHRGEETRRCGATISGQVLVYDAEGREAFRGGITAARAHEGDNDGARAVLALLSGKGAGTAEAPVFGCPLGG